MSQRIPTNWDSYNSDSSNLLDRILFLDPMARAYSDLLKKASFKAPISILELGCGTGYTTLRISQMVPVKKVVLVDSNARMLQIAKRTLVNVDCEKEFIQKDFFKLNLNQEFDLVHSGGVVEHFEDKARKQLIAIHSDLVSSGGYCIIYAPTPTLSYKIVRRIAETFSLWNFPDEVPLPKRRLIQEIKDAGLTPLDSNYFWKLFLTEVGIISRKNKK